MKKIVKINNLNFDYNGIKVFTEFNCELFNQNTSIIGTAASGKTTLAKILNGIYLNDQVEIFDLKLNKKNINNIRKKLMVVHNEYNFIAETVADEIAFGMENLRYSQEKMREIINNFAILFNLEDKLEYHVNTLSKSDQTIIKILSFLAMEPQIIVFDDVLIHLDPEIKEKLIIYLKQHKINFINFTSDIEEVLFSDYLIVLDKGQIIIEGNMKSVLKEEKILKRFGFNLPFSVDLSGQLKIYGILKETFYDIDDIIGELWK